MIFSDKIYLVIIAVLCLALGILSYKYSSLLNNDLKKAQEEIVLLNSQIEESNRSVVERNNIIAQNDAELKSLLTQVRKLKSVQAKQWLETKIPDEIKEVLK